LSASRSDTGLHFHLILGWALVAATLYLACFKVPLREKTLSESYLIFFYHFPSAMSCLVFFILAGVVSIWHLMSQSIKADHLAASSVEIGFLACTICLVTGMIWADAAWGKPWVWHDKRLLSVAIMWFCYLAYLVFRANLDNPEQRARFSSVMGILFAINVPMVWFAIRIFGKVSHPRVMQVDLKSPAGEFPYMKFTQWFGFVAFLILYLAFLRLRYRSQILKSEVDHLGECFTDKDI
jgi:heme exporter protein C